MAANDEQGPDGFPFTAFATNLDREVDDRAECFEWDLGFESLEVTGGESCEVIAKVDDGK